MSTGISVSAPREFALIDSDGEAENEPGLVLRSILKDGAPWFIAKDVCDALGLSDRSKAVRGLDEDEKGTTTVPTLRGPQSLIKHAGLLHAILVHLDASPTGPRNRTWIDERRWVSAAFEALQPGGLLAIAGSRHVANLTRRLQGSGFEVAEFTVPSSPNAKRPRFLPIWLGRKGKAAD